MKKATTPIQNGIQRFNVIVSAASTGLRSCTTCPADEKYPTILVLNSRLAERGSKTHQPSLPLNIILGDISDNRQEIGICDIHIPAKKIDKRRGNDGIYLERFIEVACSHQHLTHQRTS
jgi:hypothetical protein